MNLDDALKKSGTDIDEIMSSIEAIKGQRYVQILSLHINYTSLVTLSRLLEQEDVDVRLAKAIQKTAVLCASTSLALICEQADMSRKDLEELIKWGDRLEKTISGNLKQVKEDE